MNLAFDLNPHPERQLLLHAARTSLEPERIVIMQELISQVDWNILLPLATTHGMLPLLYHHLTEQQDFCSQVPTGVLLTLKERCSLIARQNLALTGNLFRVYQLLASHGIAAMAYKGPTLAHTAYGNVGLRPFLDIDILVRSHDSLEAYRVMRRNGYNVEHNLPEELLLRVWAHRYVQDFVSEDGHGLVEMHWSLVNPRQGRSLCIEEAWGRRVPSTLSPELDTLSREDLVIALCLHGARHEWNRLEWICCLAQIIRTKHSRDELDWSLLFSLARRYGCRNVVKLGIDLACDLLNISRQVLSPSEVNKEYGRYPQVSFYSIRQHIWGRIFDPQPPDPTLGSKAFFNEAIRYWKLQDRFIDGLNARWQMWKYLWSPAPIDYCRANLPSSLHHLYTLFMLQRRMSVFFNPKLRRTSSQKFDSVSE